MINIFQKNPLINKLFNGDRELKNQVIQNPGNYKTGNDGFSYMTLIHDSN